MTMLWVDYEYYLNEYRMGSPPIIPSEQFLFFVKQAQEKMNWRKVVIENPSNTLKDCVCEVAEAVYNKNDGTDIRKIIDSRLSNTEYYNDFVYRGL